MYLESLTFAKLKDQEAKEYCAITPVRFRQNISIPRGLENLIQIRQQLSMTDKYYERLGSENQRQINIKSAISTIDNISSHGLDKIIDVKSQNLNSENIKSELEKSNNYFGRKTKNIDFLKQDILKLIDRQSLTIEEIAINFDISIDKASEIIVGFINKKYIYYENKENAKQLRRNGKVDVNAILKLTFWGYTKVYPFIKIDHQRLKSFLKTLKLSR